MVGDLMMEGELHLVCDYKDQINAACCHRRRCLCSVGDNKTDTLGLQLTRTLVVRFVCYPFGCDMQVMISVL
jgi:hypothetical protein